jgi:hypothetical protein
MAYYTYYDISLNCIFSKNDSDATNTTITNFKENNTSLIYNNANGTVSKQNSIYYTATPTNYFSNLSAYYLDYQYQVSEYTIFLNNQCIEMRILLCGAGGSGGSGAGDRTGQRGESGSGGGGGAYFYLSHTITTVKTFYLTIGAGGAPVNNLSDTKQSGNYGSNGYPGGNTSFYQIKDFPLVKANGGLGGKAGTPDNYVVGGEGANTGIGTLISGGSPGDGSTADRGTLLVSNGGNSGWVIKKNGDATYPKYSQSYSNNYGNGGAGSCGEYDPQTNYSGPGENGWARIYFLY